MSAAVVEADRVDWRTVFEIIGRGFESRMRRAGIRGLRRRRKEGLDMVDDGNLVDCEVQ